MAEITLTALKTAMMARELSGSISGWNGYDQHLQVGADDTWKWRPVIKWSVDTTGWGSIQSAILRLTYYSTAGNHAVQSAGVTDMRVARMTMDWGRGVIDPGDADVTTQEEWGWNSRQDKWDMYVAEDAIDQGSTGQTLDIDVTSIVDGWFRGAPNFGVMLINATSEIDSDSALLFYSDNFGTIAYHPTLIINYTLNTAPDVPVDRQPADSTSVDTLLPRFTWRFSDADAGDYMTAYSIEVISGQDLQPVWQSGWQEVTSQEIYGSVVYGSVTSSEEDEAEPLVPGATYAWTIQVQDKHGAVSTLSDEYTFTANSEPDAPDIEILPAPTDALTTTSPIIAFVHSDPDPSDSLMFGYEVAVDVKEDGIWYPFWDTDVVDTSELSISSAYVQMGSPLDWGTTYRASARTQDGYGVWSDWSDPEEFTTYKTGAGEDFMPSDTAFVSPVPTFSGKTSSANDVMTAYWLRVYADDMTTEMLAATRYTSGITQQTWFTKEYSGAALTPGNWYYWQAKIESSVGGEGDWTDLRAILVQPVDAPILVSPQGDQNYDLTPTISYQHGSMFNRIQFQVYGEDAQEWNLDPLIDSSGTISSGITGSGPYVYSESYSLDPLEFGVGYKIRARVSSDGGSNWSEWSGLAWFKTKSVSRPILLDVNGDTNNPAWTEYDNATVGFSIETGNGETIDYASMQVWDETGTDTVASYELTSVGDTSATFWVELYVDIPPGMYMWNAMYITAAGAISPWSEKKSFKANTPPYVPSGMFPPPGHVFDFSEDKTFMAEFYDEDVWYFGDYGTQWQIEIDYAAGGDFDLENIYYVQNGLNVTDWGGNTLNSDDYIWRTRFKDSKNEWGQWSGWSNFSVAARPTAEIQSPVSGSSVSSVTPTVSWSFSGGTQERYKVKVNKIDQYGNLVDYIGMFGPYYGEATSFEMPSGYLKDKYRYRFTLKVLNQNELESADSTSDVLVELDAPNAVGGVDAIANEERSRVKVFWNPAQLKTNHTFKHYGIFRRRPGIDKDWIKIGEVKNRYTTDYTDWYAGNNVVYEYTVRAITTKSGGSVVLESPDGSTSFATTSIPCDDWIIIGEDRNSSHIHRLLVTDESHNRPIQQEVFETLGSSRKVIMRGFVLGHEGSVTSLWANVEVEDPQDSQSTISNTLLARRLVDYLTRKAGPHILKTPFGDVWDIQISDPEYTFQPVGHLEVSFNWIETGNTSRHI
jgi:hypothetical protein